MIYSHTHINRKVSVDASNIFISISCSALPLISTPSLKLNGTFILSQLIPPKRFMQYNEVELSERAIIDLESPNNVPIKIYFNIETTQISGKESLISYGRCLEKQLDRLSLAAARISKSEKIPVKFLYLFILHLF